MNIESFARDFFGMNRDVRESWTGHYERKVIERALKLAEGAPPSANLTPYLELVAAADRLNLDVVRRP